MRTVTAFREHQDLHRLAYVGTDASRDAAEQSCGWTHRTSSEEDRGNVGFKQNRELGASWLASSVIESRPTFGRCAR